MSMDTYTVETQKWLDERFRMTDASGVYVAHQPIYGFRKGPCEDDNMRRYIITYQILKALGRLHFGSLLDVGGAEGYKAALVREVFGAAVTSCDLSAEASLRALQIFNVPGRAVDIVNLPYETASFDVVLSSETLEHVVDIERATRELVRVAKRAVVITVPKESREQVERNVREKVPHGHIQALTLSSFDWLEAEGIKVIGRPISSRGLLSLPIKLVAAEEDSRPHRGALGNVRTHVRNRLMVPLARALLGKGAAAKVIEMDDVRSASRLNSRGLLFILVKDPTAIRDQPVPISPMQVLDFEVPYHYPQGEFGGAARRSQQGVAGN
jgi:SAM-dependent methyltransferase